MIRLVLHRHLLCPLFGVLLLLAPAPGFADLTTPLSVVSQFPLTLVHGLPGMGHAELLEDGTWQVQLGADVTSHFILEQSGPESLVLDGESYRSVLQLAYGLGKGLEVGLELPYLEYAAGSLDGFIDSWHSFFHLPTSGREKVTKDQLNMTYAREGVPLFSLAEKRGGLGDIRLRGAWQLAGGRGAAHSAALHASLKLPTGDSDKLTGSGAADLALWLSVARRGELRWGDFALTGALGVLALGDGEVLAAEQRSLVVFGGLGVALQPWQRVRLQLQLDAHGPFYHSQIRGVGTASVQLASGGAILFADGHELELAVIEDVYFDSAPDVVFHAAWRKRF